jgi:hypothetical protein
MIPLFAPYTKAKQLAFSTEQKKTPSFEGFSFAPNLG